MSLGRATDNDLLVPEDLLVSGHHAEVRRTADGRVFELSDRNSANKTWVDGEALVADHRIQLGSVFVLGGQTAIRIRRPEVGETSHRPDAADLVAARSQLLSRVATNVNSALGAAAMVACQEQRGYINDRHLFLGLAMTEADQPLFERGRGPIDETLLYELLWRENFWDDAPWVTERLKQARVNVFFAYKRSWTPRLIRVLQEADEVARQRGRSQIGAVDLLRVMIGDDLSRVHRWLTRRGAKVADLLSVLDSTPMAPAAETAHDQTIASREQGRKQRTEGPKHDTAAARPGASVSRGTDSLYFTGSFTSGDPKLDNQAQEAGRQLYGFAALYQLAETEDRRQGMRRLLEEHMADVPADKRRTWLEQLRRLFPLDSGSAQASEEIERLHRWVTDLRSQVTELETEVSGRGGSLPWHLVLDSPSEIDLDVLNPAERPRVEMLREVFEFSQRLEMFITGVVQDLNFGTVSGSTSLQLPGHRVTLRNHINDIKAGRQVSLSALRAYLVDLETWLAAGFIALNKASEEWFKEFWSEYSPRAIEARADSGFARFGPNLWNRYKEAARRISPDIAAQHIRRKAQELAKNRHRQLAQGRNSVD